MKKTLFINACVRKNSRTFSLSKTVLDRLNDEYIEVDLQRENLQPLNRERLEKREKLVMQGDFSDDMFKLAKDFAAADTIVIAAPYWDLTFPALLKIYLEQITVCGITFEYSKGVPHSLCKAKRLIYITTAGGEIYKDYGFEYIKTISETFFSIPEILCFKAEGLDIKGADVGKIMAEAKEKIKHLQP